MPRISFDRSELPQASLVLLSTLAALALMAWVLAYWTWIWLLPRAESRGDDLPTPVASISSAANLFGVVQRAAGAAPATGIALRLQGVVAATPAAGAQAAGAERGYAVVQLDAKKTVAVLEGEEIAPGVRLAEVHADHVILERGGLRETLAWPPRNTHTPPAPVNAPPPPNASAPPPPNK